MNEKIKELWEQAAKTTQGDSWQEQTKFMEKFAELIIEECCEVLREEVEVALSAVGDVAYPERLVRKHFGVEE